MPGSRPSAARPGWLVPVVIAVAVVAVAAGVAARALYVEEPSRGTASPARGAPATAPGASVVRLTQDAARHPEQASVRHLVQEYFDAINDGDYQRWARTVTEERVNSKPESVWHQEYASTTDGGAVIYRISSAGTGRLRILLAFTSVQDPGDAPQDFARRCIRWKVVFGLAADEGQWKLDAGQTAASPQKDPC